MNISMQVIHEFILTENFYKSFTEISIEIVCFSVNHTRFKRISASLNFQTSQLTITMCTIISDQLLKGGI